MIADGKPFLGSTHVKTLTDLVHLIAVPGTLLAQWEMELKFWFRPKVVDIIVYQGKMQHSDLWGEGGYIKLSKHRKSHIIILTSHSVTAPCLFCFLSADSVTPSSQIIQRDFHDAYKSKTRANSKRKLPWDLAHAKNGSHPTIFDHKYLSVALDEAHLFRNIGPKHFAALSLLKQAHLRLVLTATPLHTSTKVRSS
jgi:TATA-binding protein-associated factor